MLSLELVSLATHSWSCVAINVKWMNFEITVIFIIFLKLVK